MRKFNNEKDELLIELVKGKKPIYDASDNHYKNNIVKHKCWEEISAIVDLSVSECKKRWKSLRDQFNKQKKDCGTGSARVNGSWEYGTLMSFLSDSVYDRRKTLTSVQSESQEDSTQRDTQEDIEEDTQKDAEKDTQENVLDETLHAEPRPTEGANQRHPLQSRQTPKTKKRKVDLTMELLNKREAQRSLVYEKLLKGNPSAPSSPPISNIRKFFDSMADIVEGFPPRDQAQIRLKVCQLVTETEIKLTAPASHYPRCSLRLGSSDSDTTQIHYILPPMLSDGSLDNEQVETPMPSSGESTTKYQWL